MFRSSKQNRHLLRPSRERISPFSYWGTRVWINPCRCSNLFVSHSSAQEALRCWLYLVLRVGSYDIAYPERVRAFCTSRTKCNKGVYVILKLITWTRPYFARLHLFCCHVQARIRIWSTIVTFFRPSYGFTLDDIGQVPWNRTFLST